MYRLLLHLTDIITWCLRILDKSAFAYIYCDGNDKLSIKVFIPKGDCDDSDVDYSWVDSDEPDDWRNELYAEAHAYQGAYAGEHDDPYPDVPSDWRECHPNADLMPDGFPF